jgi:hypothetical protein
MEFRKVRIGFDSEAAVYFIADDEFKHLSAEALSFELMRKQLETLELRPVLCPIFGAKAPELRKPRTERSAVPKFKRLKLDEIPKRQRRGR